MSEVALSELPLAGNDRGWASAHVSSRSRFGDDLWVLDIQTAGTRADQRRVDWNIALPPGALITQADLGALIATAKRFLWTMATNPPSGRKRSSATTLKMRALILRTLLLWMAAEGIPRFAEIDRWAVGRFTTWLRGRPGRRAVTVTPNTIVNYMVVLKDLYRQRAKLDDAPLVDPLPLETTYEAAGVTRETKGAIPFIPDAVAIDLLSKALTWVEVHGDTIIAAEDLRRETRAASRAAGRSSRGVPRCAACAAPSGVRGPNG